MRTARRKTKRTRRPMQGATAPGALATASIADRVSHALLHRAAKWCPDIGLWALDRSLASCKAGECTTAMCGNCYVRSNMVRFPSMGPKDVVNDECWAALTPGGFRLWLDYGPLGGPRRTRIRAFRFCTRGEPMAMPADIAKVKACMEIAPEVTCWVPTRCHQGPQRTAIRDAAGLDNARVLASVDYTTSRGEYRHLREQRWSMLYVGDDGATEGRELCPKTHHLTGNCADCLAKGERCGSPEPTEVHLQLHGC